MVLPTGFGGFMAAVANATPGGITIVEDAIDLAISEIKKEIPNLKPEEFSQNAFIPKSAFGTTDAAPEVALHHARAHRVMKETLDGVLQDLENFKAACALARTDIKDADDTSAAEMQLQLQLVDTLNQGVTDHGDASYDDAVVGNADTVATEENPAGDPTPAQDPTSEEG